MGGSPRLHRLCPPRSRRSSDQLDLVVDGLPVSLPSYEEAVYSSWGERLATSSTPGPTQLLLAQESPSSHQPLLSGQNPNNPPPPYEEVQSPQSRDRTAEGDIRELHLPLTEDKDAR